MSLRPARVDVMWTKLGYDVDDKSADVKATLRIGTTIILRTKRSHGSGKLDGQIPNMIRQQMKLNEAQFADAYDCPLSREMYIEILRSKGYIPTGM